MVGIIKRDNACKTHRAEEGLNKCKSLLLLVLVSLLM